MFNPTYFPRQRWTYPKDHEKNFVAALFHLATIIMFCFSLTQLEWFCIWGGNCAHHLALYQFFSFNSNFETIGVQNKSQFPGNEIMSPFIIQYHSSDEALPCVTPDVVDLMHIIIILCFLSILFSLVGFCLDVIGPTRKMLIICRRNALPSITTELFTMFTVLLVVSVVGVCYLVSRSLEISAHQMNAHTKIQVTYEYGCYVVTAAGAVSILATACNLLQPHTQTEDSQSDHLVEDWDGLETFSVGMRNIPIPPPPYTP